MKQKVRKPSPEQATSKSEIVRDKDPMDYELTGRYMNNNPYKTPPNNMTTKSKD